MEEVLGSRDVTVPFLEGAATDRGGVLEPVGYVFHRRSEGPEIYDYELKNEYSDLVELITPLPLPELTIAKLRELALTAVQVFAVRDLGRADFRVSDEGAVSFLELNPLPYLHPETSIYAAAALEGVEADGVISSVIASAARRWSLTAD